MPRLEHHPHHRRYAMEYLVDGSDRSLAGLVGSSLGGMGALPCVPGAPARSDLGEAE